MSPVTSHPYLSEEQQKELQDIAKALSRPGGGILAADETPKAMEARFASLKIENTPEVRLYVDNAIGIILKIDNCTFKLGEETVQTTIV